MALQETDNPLAVAGAVHEPRPSSMSSRSWLSVRSTRASIAPAIQAIQRRKKVTAIAIAVAAAVVIAVVAASVVVSMRSTASAVLQLPKTFSAQFSAVPTQSSTLSQTSSLSGILHKTLRDDGTWQLTGQVVVQSHNETFTIQAADDGGIYYTVTWTADGAILKQGCVQPGEAPDATSVHEALQGAVFNPEVDPAVMPASWAGGKVWSVVVQGLSCLVLLRNDGSLELLAPGYQAEVSSIDMNVSPVSPFTGMINATTQTRMACPTVQARSLAAVSGSYNFPPLWPRPAGAQILTRLLQEFEPARALASVVVVPLVPPRFVGRPRIQCVFVHGAGVNYNAPPVNNFYKYWGAAASQVNGACASIKMLQMDTTNQAWDDPDLHTAFCGAAATNGVISNTLLFAHGSGNLIVAAALLTNKCSVDWRSTQWKEMQADYNAARLSDYAQQLCGMFPMWSAAQFQLQRDFNMCSGKQLTLGWRSMLGKYQPTGVTWSAAASFIKSKVSGAMCGCSAFGFAGSSYCGGIPHFMPNPLDDTDWSTCWDDKYSSNFRRSLGAFYWLTGNYMDVTCRNGDGMYGADRQPCRWYTLVANAAA